MNSLLELFVSVDDFWQAFHPYWHQHLLETGARKRLRDSRLCESEIMTIVILFHQSHYRDFKAFYEKHVQQYLSAEFPNLVAYCRRERKPAIWLDPAE